MHVKRIALKLSEGRIWQRLVQERLNEPLHLNLASIPVAVFGSFRAKVALDLVMRQHHAYSLLRQADLARRFEVDAITVCEFGVASGVGLLNLASIAARVQKVTGVEIFVAGFDTGTGMPPPRDYRDHPEFYSTGDFPMNVESLRERLPANTTLILGDVAETVPEYLAGLTADRPLAFASIDVDYYSSACDALTVFDGEADRYLPTVLVYLDDVMLPTHNLWSGELLAVEEFNAAHPTRKIDHGRFIRPSRVLKGAPWIAQMRALHVLDHPARQPDTAIAKPQRKL